jgi:glutaredoxin-related protein
MDAVEERKDDLRMMRDPSDWPHYPLLCVKRETDGGTDVGVMAPNTPSVWLVNIHELGSGVLRDILEAHERLNYDSYEAIQADGWIVD